MAETITIPDELARRIRERVENGDFSSPAEVISAGLDSLDPMLDDQQHLESIRTRVRAAIDNPLRYTAAEVREHLESHAARLLEAAAKKHRA